MHAFNWCLMDFTVNLISKHRIAYIVPFANAYAFIPLCPFKTSTIHKNTM